jgi:hypothetical protein
MKVHPAGPEFISVLDQIRTLLVNRGTGPNSRFHLAMAAEAAKAGVSCSFLVHVPAKGRVEVPAFSTAPVKMVSALAPGDAA